MTKKQIWILSGTVAVLCMCVMVGGIAAYLLLNQTSENPNQDVASDFPSIDEVDTASEQDLETVKLTDSSGEARDPLITFDGAGELHLIYNEPRDDPPYKVFFHRQMTPDGTWSSAQEMGAEIDELDGITWLLRHPTGKVCAFGPGVIAKSYDLLMSCLENGQWSELMKVGRDSGHPAFAADGSIQSISNRGNGKIAFQDIILSDEITAYPHAFTIDSRGGYHVFWTRQGDPFSLEYRYSNDGGQTWSEQESLTSGGGDPTVLVADTQGNVHLASASSQRFYHRWTPAGGWETPVDLGCCSGTADMAIDSNGLPHIVWNTMDGGLYMHEQADGEWQELPLPDFARIAVDQQGRRHFVWLGEDGGLYYGMLP
ncbi:MAG: exo-alpha-sialidase [Anaerolineae bacterium]|nr:exo-alpha-sialidase [Anaerolineae bacterium]